MIRFAKYLRQTYATNYRSFTLCFYNSELGLDPQTLHTLVVSNSSHATFQGCGEEIGKQES